MCYRICTMEVSRQKSFAVFTLFACPRNFLYDSSRWLCSYMDLRESMRGSMKVSLQRSACITCAKLFCLVTFIVYGICVIPINVITTGWPS